MKDEDELLLVVEVTPQALYQQTKNKALTTLAYGRRDINRLSSTSFGLGDDQRAEAEVYIAKLEAITKLLETM